MFIISISHLPLLSAQCLIDPIYNDKVRSIIFLETFGQIGKMERDIIFVLIHQLHIWLQMSYQSYQLSSCFKITINDLGFCYERSMRIQIFVTNHRMLINDFISFEAKGLQHQRSPIRYSKQQQLHNRLNTNNNTSKQSQSNSMFHMLKHITVDSHTRQPRRISQGELYTSEPPTIKKNQSLIEIAPKQHIRLKSNTKFHTNEYEQENSQITRQHNKLQLQRILLYISDQSRSVFVQSFHKHYDEFFLLIEKILDWFLKEHSHYPPLLAQNENYAQSQSYSDMLHQVLVNLRQSIQTKLQLERDFDELSLANKALQSKMQVLQHSVKALSLDKCKLSAELQTAKAKQQALSEELRQLENSCQIEKYQSTTQKFHKNQPTDDRQLQGLLKAQFKSIQQLMNREKLIRHFFRKITEDDEIDELLSQYLKQCEIDSINDHKQGKPQQPHIKIIENRINISGSSLADQSIINESDESSFDFAWKNEMSQSAQYFNQTGSVGPCKQLYLRLDTIQ